MADAGHLLSRPRRRLETREGRPHSAAERTTATSFGRTNIGTPTWAQRRIAGDPPVAVFAQRSVTCTPSKDAFIGGVPNIYFDLRKHQPWLGELSTRLSGFQYATDITRHGLRNNRDETVSCHVRSGRKTRSAFAA